MRRREGEQLEKEHDSCTTMIKHDDNGMQKEENGGRRKIMNCRGKT